ncbi:repressor protein cI [Synechococcus phage Yong-M3-232]|nr:repressor protein cI [Synechococcus phage Yong-M3-232]
MSASQSERLKAAREKAGYKSAQAAAEAFGWGVAGYRHHENGTRGFGLDVAKKYGRAFKVKPGWLLGMDGVDDGPITDFQADAVLTVGAKVAAGIWREDEAEIEMIEIDTPPIVPNAKRLGFIVEGRSMDEFYQPGTVLNCVSIHTNGIEPEEGDHVIVRRTKPDGLRELTVKEFHVRDGEFYLRPRSTLPDFQELRVGRPDENMLDGEEVCVIAFVVGSIPPAALRLLERMGKIRRV